MWLIGYINSVPRSLTPAEGLSLVILIAGAIDLLSSGKAVEQGLRAANGIGIPI